MASAPTAPSAFASQPETVAFLQHIAALLGRELLVTTRTNHSRYTVDGRVSDHATGHAADLGMAANGGGDDSPVGDRIMRACLITAGVPADRATAGPLPVAALREPALHTAIATPPVADRRLRSSRMPRGGSAVQHRKSDQHDLRSARRSI